MQKTLDVLSIALVAGGASGFALGIDALGESRDLHAVYWLVVGALLLRAATDMLRPLR